MPPLKGSVIALDTETTGLDLFHGAAPFFVTTCDGEGSQKFWEWDVDPETRSPVIPPEDADEVRELIASVGGVVMHNSRFDVKVLQISGVIPEWDWRETQDTIAAGHVLDSKGRHDLTSMVMEYLGEDMSPVEDALGEAVRGARRFARREFPSWKLAEKGLPDMPSVKSGSREKESRGDQSESPWRSDMWLPRAVAQEAGYAVPDPECRHDWVKEECIRCGGHRWWVALVDYSNEDSLRTRQLWPVLEGELRRRSLWAIYAAKMRVMRPVCMVETGGVTVSVDRLGEIRNELKVEVMHRRSVCGGIAEAFGYALELPKSGRNKNLDQFVFEVMKLEKVKDPRGKSKSSGPMLDQKIAIPYYLDTLPAGSRERAFVRNLAAERKRATAVTYLDGYERFLLPVSGLEGWGVLHPSLNPCGTDTLRFSSGNPNSQSVGGQDVDGEGEDARSVRHCFGPATGREWWSIDYENIELRIPAFESGERCMVDLFEQPDDAPYFGSYHLLNASILFPDLFWPVADIKGEFKKRYPDHYKWTKGFGFSFSYGGQEATCDRAAHRPGGFREVRGNLKEHSRLNQKYVDAAMRLGYVETLPDCTVDPSRGYPVRCSRSQFERVSPTIPLNYHVQSTAGWCITKAMVRCQDLLDTWNAAEPGAAYRMTMQVHDEIVFDFPVGGRENTWRVEELRRAMEESGSDIGVPLRASASYHPVSWGDADPVPKQKDPGRVPGPVKNGSGRGTLTRTGTR